MSKIHCRSISPLARRMTVLPSLSMTWRILIALLFCFGPVDRLKLIAQEPDIFVGHNGGVMMAAFAADNDRVVTASSDLTARLWDVKTGAELQTWSQHTGPLYCLSVSADGRTLVTGAQDNTLRIWDVPLSHPVRRLTAPSAAILDMAYSADGKSLVCGSADKLVRLFDVSSNTSATIDIVPTVRSHHADSVHAVAYRNDGACFASADHSGRITIWSPDIDLPLGHLSGHSGLISQLAFHPNNQQLISAGDDGLVRVWQLMPALSKILATADKGGTGLSVVAGQSSVIQSTAGDCRLINAQTGEVIREFSGSDTLLTDATVAPNNSFLLQSSVDGKSSLVNFSDGSAMGIVAGHLGAISDSAISSDGQLFATAGVDGTVRLWTRPVNAVNLSGHAAAIRGVATATSGQWVATISDDMTTRIWNNAGALVRQLGGHVQPLRAVATRDDDALLATGDAEGTVWIWNPSTGTAEGVVAAHTSAIASLAFSSDRNSLITASSDGVIRSWTLPLPKQKPADGEESPKPAWEFKSADNAAIVQILRHSQDFGLLALTANANKILRLNWDGTPLAPIVSPAGLLKTVDVSSNGTSLLATSDAGHVHLFSADGTLQKTLPPADGLTAARFDREGKLLLLCDGQNRVRIVDFETGRVLEELPTSFSVQDAAWFASNQRTIIAVGAHNDGALLQRCLVRYWDETPGGASAVCFVPNQQQLMCAGADGSLRRWSLADGSVMQKFDGAADGKFEISVSPDNKIVGAVGRDKTLHLWKQQDGALVHTITHPVEVRSLSFSADSARVATASVDGLVRVFDAASGLLLESFREHAPGTEVTSVRYLNDNQTLVSTGDDKTVRLMKTSILRTISVHPKEVKALAMINAGAQIVSAGNDGRVVMTNLSTGSTDRVFVTGDRKAVAVASRADNQRVAAGFESGELLVWNANNGEQPLLKFEFSSAVHSLAWSPDNRKLIVATADNNVRILGPTRPGVQPPVELVQHQQFSTDAGVTKMLFSQDSRSVWISQANGRLDEWSYAGVEQRRQFNHGGPVYGVAANRDGSIVVSCSTDQTVRVWDTTTGQQKFQLNGHSGAVHAVAMSPDETFVVSSGADGTLRLWDIAGGRQLKQLITYNATMYSVAMHPNGALIASAGADRKVHLLDMITGVEQNTLNGHTDYIHCVAFSPNGEQLLSYGYSGQLKLWNTADGRLLHESRVGNVGNYAQFAPDGRRVVVANGDGTASVHSLP